MIIKDSYGNALPGYLFGSFEDIYVVDFRYFTKNIVNYVNDNQITDILFANNLQHAYANPRQEASSECYANNANEEINRL